MLSSIQSNRHRAYGARGPNATAFVARSKRTGTAASAWAITHLLSKARQLPQHRQAFADAARLFWGVDREDLADFP